MRTTIKGKNVDVSRADRSYAEQKLRRLERLLDDRSEAIVELSSESHRNAETSHLVDVTLLVRGRTLRGAAGAATYRAALDQVVDKLERQVVTYKRRPLLRRRQATRHAGLPISASPEGTDEAAERRPVVVKTKRFAIEPMFEEDAVARMEELGHSFFIFVNAENERLAVLYRRADGDYGLIEPTIGGEYTPGTSRRRRA